MIKTGFLPSIHAPVPDQKFMLSCSSEPEYENVKICVIGSKRSIHTTIYGLHSLGFAEVNAWSTPQPTGAPGEYISVFIRRIRFEQ